MSISIAAGSHSSPKTALPTSSKAELAGSVRVWLALVAYLFFAKVMITYVFPVTFERGSGQAEVFSWPSLAIFAVLGLCGVWLAHRTGFPAAWSARISNRQRVLLPVLLGAGFGLIGIALDLFDNGTRLGAAATGNATFNMAFPGSLFAYSGGAVLVEVLYRFFTIPLLLWITSNLIFRGRYQVPIFWVLAIILSAWEPYSQARVVATPALAPGWVAAQMVYEYALNLSEVTLFRRYGFFAAYVLRVADYLVWHIAYGNFICAC